ncbi:Nucleoporin [Kalmanozyma brasiliensis GHG001]|uniref:Nucleoporin NUP188 n=1 Tax=Kalmanozyma brasiliensis (strain GHG001) TaxID=1365824 RepID=V5EVS7_KALBG|nr:Nucleoporin [Kalmanozyma brasiliensis GHG001]EST07388.1 Nucleoporin [Kalmanozyma brasiliensis GHG001]
MVQPTAQAGPSTSQPSTSKAGAASSSSSLFVSYHDIFEHLELARHQRDAHQIQSILSSRSDQLKSCLQPFPVDSSPDFTSTSDALPPATLKLSDGSTHNLQQETRQLCKQIADQYHIPHQDAFVQLSAFRASEHRYAAGAQDIVQSHLQAAPPTPVKTRTTRNKTASSALQRSTQSKTEPPNPELLDAFNIFYFEERMYLLRTISSLIRITEDPQHEFYDLANDILDLFADETFALSCIQHFCALANLSLPESIRLQPRYSSLWAKQILREQFGLLEIVFLLFYGRLSPSPASLLALLRAVHETEVGRRQANLGFFDNEATETVECVSHLLVLIAVEMLSLEEVMDGLDLNDASQSHMAKHPPSLEQALDLLSTTSADPLHAPILLAWALVLHRLEDALAAQFDAADLDTSTPPSDSLAELANVIRTDDGGPPLWRRLAQAAFAPELRLFDTLMSLLASPLLTSSNGASTPAVAGPSALAYRAVFKGLLLSITELVKPEFLPNFNALVSLWEATFGSGLALELSQSAVEGVAALCDQFWQVDSRYESRCTTLDTARRRWPVSFRPLILLTKALSGHARVDARASWPSLLDGRSRPETEERACAAVFDYLANVPTFAQVLPVGANTPNAPFETMEGGDYTSVTYRITRTLRIPGTQVRLAPGTTGSTISELGKEPVIVLWSPARPISAWKLMRDVLSSFPPAYAEPTTTQPDADPFRDQKQAVRFSHLAPADCDEPWEELASDVLDLFASIISASAELAWTLLAHLDGRDINADELSLDYEPEELEQIQKEKEELAHAKSLSSVAVRLLSHALIAAPINVRLVRSSLRLLTVLLPYDPDAIWQEVRSSNALIGTPGSVPYLSKGTAAAGAASVSALLTQEMSHASYGGLISLLDFHISLFSELRRSYSVLSTDVLETKTNVLLRAFSWIYECVWPEYQSWRYIRLADRLEIGTKCTKLFEMVLEERSWRRSSTPASDLMDEAGPDFALYEAAERSFVTHPSIVGLAPLITCIGTGQQLLDALGRAGRQNDAILAEEWISTSLRLATQIVSTKRELTIAALRDLLTLPAETARRAMSARINVGLFERLFFDHTIVASRTAWSGSRRSSRVELASATFSYVLFPASSAISSTAAQLVTSVLRSVADLASAGKPTPGLIGHMGTLEELEETLSGLVDLVGNPNQDPGLKVQVWTMLAAIVDTQPALGTLLLTGRHLAVTTETRLKRTEADPSSKQNESAGSAPPPQTTDANDGQALVKTALDVASEAILSWQAPHTSSPQLLEAVLRFLDVAWVHAAEHVAAFDTIRTNSAFFRALADIICEPSEIPSTLAEGVIESDTALHSSNDVEVSSYCYRKMCQARSLRLLQHDIQLGSILKDQSKSSSSSRASVDALLDILTSSDRTLGAIEVSFSMPCDPSLRAALERKLAELFPTVCIDSLRHPRRKDDFDLDKRYGDNYHFSTSAFRSKAEGRVLDGEFGGEAALIEEGLLSLFTINMEWSLIDVQNSVVQAWTQCVETCMGRIVAQALSKDKVSLLGKVVIASWTRLATLTADEGREGDFMRGVHATRLALLTKLMELAWGNSHSKEASSTEQIVQAATLCGRLLTHGFFRVEDSLKGTVPPEFHRDVFEMVLVCVARIRSLLSSQGSMVVPNDKTIESHKALHASVELFCRQATEALRIKIESALRVLQTAQRHDFDAQYLEDDLDVLVSIFEMTIRRDVGAETTVWLAHVQETQLLQFTISLLGRAPVLRPESANGNDTHFNPNSAHHVAFMKPLLSLLLAVASQPCSSEELALQGAVNALASNMLTDPLENGQISPLLLSGDLNPSHECWRMMLRIVVNLIDNLGAGSDNPSWRGVSARFVETDVYGFLRVYQRQIDRATSLGELHARLDSMSGILGHPMSTQDYGHAGSGAAVSLEQLEEVELIYSLFYNLTRTEPSARATAARADSNVAGLSIVQHLAEASAWTLQPLVHLLQHPNELSSLLGLDPAAEATKVVQEATAAKIRTIVSILIASLWNHTNCISVLCRGSDAWPSTQSGCAIVRPTTRTSAVRIATLGTLLDLSTHLTDYLRTHKSKLSADDKEGCSATLEQALGLAASQAAIWAAGRSKEHQEQAKLEHMARQELESGLSRDIVSALRAAEEVAGAQGNLFSLIMTFVESKLNSARF